MRLPRSDALPPAKAKDIYQAARKALAYGFAHHRMPLPKNHPGWRRYNATPYLSDTHGNRYVNNYANSKAAKAGYGELTADRRMQPGTVAVKDSYTVTDKGEVFPDALLYMQKLAPGRSLATGDWHFVQILPHGSYIGDIINDNPENVAFCFACHKVMAEVDYLFFLPRNNSKTSSPAPRYPKAGLSLSPTPIVL